MHACQLNACMNIFRKTILENIQKHKKWGIAGDISTLMPIELRMAVFRIDILPLLAFSEQFLLVFISGLPLPIGAVGEDVAGN